MEKKKEEQAKDANQDNFAMTSHYSKYSLRYNHKLFEIKIPLTSLEELDEFLDYFKSLIKDTIASESEKAKGEKSE